MFNIVIARKNIQLNHVESVLNQKFKNGRYTGIIHHMVGHSITLLSYVYKQRVKSNIVILSFSHEISNLSAEVTMDIEEYDM